jgi:hypothetical protein
VQSVLIVDFDDQFRSAYLRVAECTSAKPSGMLCVKLFNRNHSQSPAARRVAPTSGSILADCGETFNILSWQTGRSVAKGLVGENGFSANT